MKIDHNKTGDWQNYKKKQVQPMRPWTPEMPMDVVSVSEADKLNGSPKLGDMVAHNPKDPTDMWLVAKEFFEQNYEPAHAPQPVGECEWVTLEDWCELDPPNTDKDQVASINALLTKKYGHPPIVRTFNGEPASKWGLMELECISVWNGLAWIPVGYNELGQGDQWTMQPPAPKPTTEE